MKKGRWNDKWNKNWNRKSGFFLSRVLVPLFCMMLLFGGCSSEELANVDWEAVESELAALEEEMLVLEEGAYEELYGEFGESAESGQAETGGKSDVEEVKNSAETSEKQNVEEGQSKSESSEKQDAEETKKETESSENQALAGEDDVPESSEEKSAGNVKNNADVYEKSYEVVNDPIEDNSNLNAPIDKEGSYTTVEDVSLYLYTYDELPDNFMTKKEARELGWEGGSLEPYAPGMCIGGDYFGNYEGLLPKEKGRDYYECDIDTLGAKSRGAKRIVYSDDGLIYYTDDHYESFTLLYGEE